MQNVQKFLGSAKLGALLASPFIDNILAASETELRQKRLIHAQAISKLDLRELAELPEYDAKIESCRANVQAARDALAEAERRLSGEIASRSAFISSVAHERTLQMEELLRTAPPMIDEFVNDLRDQVERYHGKIGSSVQIRVLPTANPMVDAEVFSTTFPAANAWYAAILAALRETETLRLEPDPAVIAERLTDLRAGIPDPTNLEPTELQRWPAQFFATKR